MPGSPRFATSTASPSSPRPRARTRRRQLRVLTHQHGSYSFYLQDSDTNWWELEIWHDAVNPEDRGPERGGRTDARRRLTEAALRESPVRR